MRLARVRMARLRRRSRRRVASGTAARAVSTNPIESHFRSPSSCGFPTALRIGPPRVEDRDQDDSAEQVRQEGAALVALCQILPLHESSGQALVQDNSEAVDEHHSERHDADHGGLDERRKNAEHEHSQAAIGYLLNARPEDAAYG